MKKSLMGQGKKRENQTKNSVRDRLGLSQPWGDVK